MKTHRLIPSRFPPISLFEWADSTDELEKLVEVENFTNDRLINFSLLPKEDWVFGPGSSVLMAPFTHILHKSRFTDGSFGIYYAGDTLETAVSETVYHRECFFKSSNEGATFIQMREYVAHVQKPLEKLDPITHNHLLHPDPAEYPRSQKFGHQKRDEKIWGLLYPSVRMKDAHCVAIFRPPALSMPVQGCHLEYIWNGERITEVRQSTLL